jgi:hypothetical protein
MKCTAQVNLNYLLPPPENVFFLDNNPGMEKFILLASAEEILDLAARLKLVNQERTPQGREKRVQELVSEFNSFRGARMKESREHFSVSGEKDGEIISFDEGKGAANLVLWVFTIEHK